MEKKVINVNGIPRTVIVNPEASLADVLREQLGLTGTKVGCGMAHCGACSVILDGKLVRSCVTKMKKVEDGAAVTTIEGIGTPDNLHPIQMALVAHGAPQCGFCMPGFVVSAKALLDQNASPSREEVRDWFQKYRNACRCNGLQTRGRCGHGRRQGPARRDDERGPGVQAADRRQHLGQQVSPPQRHCQGDRHPGLRRRPGSEAARRDSAAGPGSGQGLPRQHPLHRHLRGGEDARGRTKW